MATRGPLQAIYLQIHPDATIGLDLCAFFEAHPNQPFTKSELKRRIGCSDRIIREGVPAAVNADRTRIVVNKGERAWTYTYLP